MKQYLFVAALFIAACGKENDAISQEDIDKAESFKVAIRSGGFQLVDYYSMEAIDYNGDGTTETDLKPYISPHLKDDTNYFAGENVAIIQGRLKFPTEPDDSFTRPYKIQADHDGVFLDFLSHEYLPLRYRLVEFTNNEFTVYASWNGKTVYSKFKRII